jgi:hypothetical protein
VNIASLHHNNNDGVTVGCFDLLKHYTRPQTLPIFSNACERKEGALNKIRDSGEEATEISKTAGIQAQ